MQQCIREYRLHINVGIASIKMPRHSGVLEINRFGDEFIVTAIVRPEEDMLNHSFRLEPADTELTYGFNHSGYYLNTEIQGKKYYLFFLGQTEDTGG